MEEGEEIGLSWHVTSVSVQLAVGGAGVGGGGLSERENYLVEV